MSVVAEKINQDLKQHQVNTEEWDYRQVAESLHLWSERFVLEFKLQTSVPAILLASLKRGTHGHFRQGRNGFGLRNEVAIAKAHLHKNEYRYVLGTLLHELLHAEQQNVGKPGRRNYHNVEFRKRAASFGLIVDEQGCQEHAPPPSPFFDLLDKYGVDVLEIPSDIEDNSSRSRSKLKAWICGCQPHPVHVRVAIKDFQARCLKCNQIFIPKESSGLDEDSFGCSQRRVENTNPTGTGFIYTRSNSNMKQQIYIGAHYETVKC
jgi:predicted SprT family Zn-dependent metalloprotease